MKFILSVIFIILIIMSALTYAEENTISVDSSNDSKKNSLINDSQDKTKGLYEKNKRKILMIGTSVGFTSMLYYPKDQDLIDAGIGSIDYDEQYKKGFSTDFFFYFLVGKGNFSIGADVHYNRYNSSKKWEEYEFDEYILFPDLQFWVFQLPSIRINGPSLDMQITWFIKVAPVFGLFIKDYTNPPDCWPVWNKSSYGIVGYGSLDLGISFNLIEFLNAELCSSLKITHDKNVSKSPIQFFTASLAFTFII